MAPHSSTFAWKIPRAEEPEGQTRLSDFTFTFHFHALEKEMATHSSVLAWRIPRIGEPGGLTSMGSHRVRHDWSDLAACSFSSNFEHYLASVWDEHSCEAVWTFFGIAFLWDWNENWPFPVLCHCWVFQICWHIDCCTFTALSFRIWNSSTGILSPPLALLVVMLPEAHSPSQSRMSGSKWEITPLCGYLCHEYLFCIVLLYILATSS